MRKLKAILEMSKFFVQGGGCTCTPFPHLWTQCSVEKEKFMKWVGLFRVRIFWVGIFRRGIFQGEFEGWEYSGCEFSRGWGDFPRTRSITY